MSDPIMKAPPKTTPQEWATLWRSRIDASAKNKEKWVQRGRKIQRIYRTQAGSVGDASDEAAKFNVFWSNVETLAPATYSRRPKVEVFRRFHDQDPVGRLAGQILERALQYEIDCRQDLHQTMKAVVKDRLLPGLGAAWVRYEPAFKTQQTMLPNPETGKPEQQDVELLADEFSPVDYVFWEDFLYSPARTWADVRWVGRELLFTREKLNARFEASVTEFGGKIEDVPCNFDPAALDDGEAKRDQSETTDPTAKRARVYELWDRDTKQIFWVAKEFDLPLDIKSDPTEFDDFFPCPQPLIASTTNNQYLPVPDYVYYQDQIRELDQVTRRISILVGSLRLIGVYDATQESLKTLLSGGLENKMVPVNAWAAFAEKGGLKGSVDFVPLDMVMKILQGLYEARDQLKQSVYEITGMADIVRGASVASETLGAQQIKAKFANLRLSSRQQQVAEFVTGLLRLKAELICKQYAPGTLIRISSVDQLPEVQDELKQAATAAWKAQQPPPPPQQAPQPGQPPAPAQPPQQPPEDLPLGDPATSTLVQRALELLKSEKVRKYRIEVTSDSMIELDESDERERRTEFMSTVSNFMNGMKNITAVAPEMMPVTLEMLKFVVRGFSVGRVLEAAIEDAISKIKKRMEQPQQPPPPDPSIQVATIRDKGETERTQMEIASKEKIAGHESQIEQLALQAKQQHEAGLAQSAQHHDALMAHMDAVQAAHSQALDQQHQNFQSAQQAQQAAMQSQQDQAKEAGETKIEKLAEGQQAILDQIGQLLQAASRLRKRVPTYDGDGNISEVNESFVE